MIEVKINKKKSVKGILVLLMIKINFGNRSYPISFAPDKHQKNKNKIYIVALNFVIKYEFVWFVNLEWKSTICLDWTNFDLGIWFNLTEILMDFIKPS